MDLDLLDTLLGPDSTGLRAITVTSLAGSAAVAGTSGGLGNDLDAALLAHLRGWADVVLVGAGTVRAEDYGPARPEPKVAERRARRGQAPAARIAVVTSSLNLDPDASLFAESHNLGDEEGATAAPLILTDHEAAESRRAEQLRAVGAEVVGLADTGVSTVLAELRRRGLSRIACEGGPSLLAAAVDADAVDALYLTVSPLLTGGVEQPLVTSGGETPRRFRLDGCHVDDDSLVFLRYLRERNAD